MDAFEKIMDSFMIVVVGTAIVMLIVFGLGAIIAPSPQKDPCEQGYIYLKGACVPGYWPRRDR